MDILGAIKDISIIGQSQQFKIPRIAGNYPGDNEYSGTSPDDTIIDA
jgi:hypothetical protein